MFAQESVMEIQKEREAFEAWYRKEYDNTVIDDSEFSEILDEYESNYYWVDELNQSWKAWQAAKAQAVPEGFVLVEKKEFEQMQEFEDLYRRAIFNSKKSIHEVNWSHVSNLGVGSTRAKAMCKRFNIDPEATFRKPQEPAND